MNPRRLLMALVAAAMFAASGAVLIVALAFALYAGVEPYVGRPGASAVVALTAALFIAFGALMISRGGRPKPKAPATPESLLERALDYVRDKPIIAVAAAIGVGILAIRNPQYFGSAIRAFFDGRNPPKA